MISFLKSWKKCVPPSELPPDFYFCLLSHEFFSLSHLIVQTPACPALHISLQVLLKVIKKLSISMSCPLNSLPLFSIQKYRPLIFINILNIYLALYEQKLTKSNHFTVLFLLYSLCLLIIILFSFKLLLVWHLSETSILPLHIYKLSTWFDATISTIPSITHN